MKNGIYRVTLKVDGSPVSGEAQVKDGAFQGLGGGLVSLQGTLGPAAANDAEGPQDSRYEELAADLSRVRVEIDAMRLMSISDREWAGEAAAYVEIARADLAALRARMAPKKPRA